MGTVIGTDWKPPPPPPPFTSSIHSPKSKSRPTTVVVETGMAESALLSRSPSNSEREEKRGGNYFVFCIIYSTLACTICAMVCGGHGWYIVVHVNNF